MNNRYNVNDVFIHEATGQVIVITEETDKCVRAENVVTKDIIIDHIEPIFDRFINWKKTDDVVKEAFNTAKEYYDSKTLAHALRVAYFVSRNPFIPEKSKPLAIAIAIYHDLDEDTEWTTDSLSDEYLKISVDLLTKTEDMTYVKYIQCIKDLCLEYPEAYLVKIADIKDHLSQKATLTKRLKDKYGEALAILL